MLRTIVAIVAISAAPAAAETITFQSDDEIMIVRWKQLSSATAVEFLANKDGSLLCVAIGADGKPIATTNGYAQRGAALFRDLDANRVAKVACRYN